jgi:hypothetical protein
MRVCDPSRVDPYSGVIVTGGVASLNHRLIAATPPGSFRSALPGRWGPGQLQRLLRPDLDTQY